MRIDDARATLEKSSLKPDTVEVVGTKEEIESISSAKAYVDLKGVNKTVTKRPKLHYTIKKENV